MSTEPAAIPVMPARTGGIKRYTEPTSEQIEEAAALMFLAATRKVLRSQEHLWDVRLELEVSYTVHNQRSYCLHATTRNGESVTGTAGHQVHPAEGTPENAAWSIAREARSAAAKRRQKAAIRLV